LPSVQIDKWAMVSAGAVVVRNVPDYGLVMGNPARLAGYICPCNTRLTEQSENVYYCPSCQQETSINT
jgi:serine acetyltransferase